MFSAIAVALLYYRFGSKGTSLWIPRSFAVYLEKRAEKTQSNVEAAALGGVTVVAELPFSISVIASVAFLLLSVNMPVDSILILSLYSLAACAPLVIVTALIGGGKKLSDIQRWREANKYFLQFIASIGLLAAICYIVVYFIVGENVT